MYLHNYEVSTFKANSYATYYKDFHINQEPCPRESKGCWKLSKAHTMENPKPIL
jgi:hypothetical protein